MKTRLLLLATLSPILAPALIAQSAPAVPATIAFEVASVHQSPPPDMQKLIAGLNAGIKPESIRIEGTRVVFTFMSLKRLIAYAYGAQTYQISGPDWLPTDRFDIVATLPAGTNKDNAPAMMQALLRDRFHLEAHRATLDDQPVLAIVTGKNGMKLKATTAAAQPLDLTQPLKPGQVMVESPAGPILLTRNLDGSSTYNMGERGEFNLKFDQTTLSMQMTSNAMTMKGVAVMINVLGGGEGREVVDMTQLPGTYEASLEFALTDLQGSLHDDGIDLPPPPPGYGGAPSDPENGATLAASMSRLGLRLDKTRASVDRLVVDKIDKEPTEN
jgi:uncharacterized protein (TIGR03435 family)